MDSLAQPPQNASLILREHAPAERAEIECFIRQCFVPQHLASITRFMPRILSLHSWNGPIAYLLKIGKFRPLINNCGPHFNFGRIFVRAVLAHKEYDKGDCK